MAGIVYSTQFFAAQGLSEDVTYFVPEGYLGVLRDIEVYCNNEEPEPSFAMIGDNAQTLWYVSLGIPAGGLKWAQWGGRSVFTNLIRAQPTDGPMDVTASGYLLSLP